MIIDVDLKYVILEESITPRALADTADSAAPELSIMCNGQSWKAVWKLEPTNAHTFSWPAKKGEKKKGVS